MKIDYIKVRGSIGFQKGLGVDEIEFDLKDKTGLVALTGPNGRGKTTLLELMSPYRTFASRKGALRHHFFLRDSFIETKFSFNNSEYHIIRKIDSESDRAEAFIVKDGESVVNGKLKEYDNYIIDLFGTQVLFYNSVFCAQGSGNMSDMTTGKIKELFVEFLRIERLVEYEQQCKQGVSFFQKKIDALDIEIQAYSESIKDLDKNREELKEFESSISEDVVTVESTDTLIFNADKTLDDLKEKALKSKHNIERKEGFENDLKELIRDRDNARSDSEKAVRDHENKKAEIVLEKSKLLQLLDRKGEIAEAVSNVSYFNNMRDAFVESFGYDLNTGRHFLAPSLKSVKDEISIIKNKMIEIENDSELTKMSFDSIGLKQAIKDIDGKINALGKSKEEKDNDSELAILFEREKTLIESISLSIHPDCELKTCPAVEKIEDSIKKLPEVKKTISDRQVIISESIALVDSLIKNKNAEILVEEDNLVKLRKKYSERNESNKDRLVDLQVSLYRNQVSEDGLYHQILMAGDDEKFYKLKTIFLDERIKTFETLSKEKPLLDIAEVKHETLQDQLKTLTENFESRKSELLKLFEAVSGKIKTIEDSVLKIDDEIDHEIDKTIRFIEDEKKHHIESNKFINRRIETNRERAAVTKNDIARKEKLSGSMDEKSKFVIIFKKEMSEWEYLRLACSKTGLQALEIDGATPLITTEANTLLEKAFGLDSQIKIITQDPESGSEVFWIKVIRDDGSEDDFGNLSGGQKIWIASALSLGMTLVSNRKSGRDFKSLFMDERDGALDGERALEFIQLYRSMMATGDFETCFFISHNQDVVAMADHEVNF